MIRVSPQDGVTRGGQSPMTLLHLQKLFGAVRQATHTRLHQLIHLPENTETIVYLNSGVARNLSREEQIRWGPETDPRWRSGGEASRSWRVYH